MSIAEQITRINKAKADIATSITNKGVTVPEGTKIDGYSALVDKIIDSATIVIEATTIANQQFLNGVGLEGKKTVVLPNVETIGSTAFANAEEIETVDIGEKVESIASTAFNGCLELSTLIFRGGTAYDGSTTIQLTGTPIARGKGYIYVPENDLENYINSQLFATGLKSQIKPLSLLGNITLQHKIITPTRNQEIVKPDEGYWGLSDVTVEPIPDNYIDSDDVTEVTLDITEVANGQFVDLKGVKVIKLPNVEKLGAGILSGTDVETLDIGSHLTQVATAAFGGATKLSTLIFRGSHSLDPINLSNTPIQQGMGYIYVPDDYVEDYRSGALSGYSDQVRPLSELEGGGRLQSKTVTPGGSELVVTPDDGYYGLLDVTVEAIPDEYQDVSSVTATAADVLKDKVFVAKDGTVVTGTLPMAGFKGTTGIILDITTVADNQFKDLKNIKKISLPNVKILGKTILYGSDVEIFDVGSNLTTVNTATFGGATKLNTLIFRGLYTSSPINLSGTPIQQGNGYIYVPDEYVENYKSGVLSGYSDQVRPLSELEGGGRLQSKTVTPGGSELVVTPDDGYYGLLDVTVEAIPDEYQDVSSVTAAAEHVLSGEKFVAADGTVVTGKMNNNSGWKYKLDTTISGVNIPEGYHDGKHYVTISAETKTTTPTKETQTIVPTDGKVLKSVTVEAIPEEYLEIPSAWTNWSNFCTNNNRAELVAKLKYDSTANGTIFNYMIESSSKVEEVPAINTVIGKSFINMFQNNTNLKRILGINVSNAATNNNIQKMFEGCPALEEVYFEGTIPVRSTVNLFIDNPLLDEENKQVLTKVLNVLENKTSEQQTVIVGSENIAKLTEQQISNLLTNKKIVLA